MESLRGEGMPADAMEGLREGLRFGGEDFLEQLIERVELKLGEGHGRKERLETGEQKAERIVCEELERLKWRESDISKESKGRPQKVEIARRIREETTMSLKWIAIRLKMGRLETCGKQVGPKREVHRYPKAGLTPMAFPQMLRQSRRHDCDNFRPNRVRGQASGL